MVLERLDESDEDRESPTFLDSEDEDEVDDADSLTSIQPPVHPVPTMQEAFEESIREAAQADEDEEARKNLPSAESRRKELLDNEDFDESWKTRWKQLPGARCHPLVKLMAQIIFGMHLLDQQQAKSDSEVVKILQTHVDEIDAFLEKTVEDFDLAIRDINERVSFLKLPMTHVEVFDIMLDDKKFRTQLIEGNDRIEEIIKRTAKAMNAALLDVEKGVGATQNLATYLDQVQHDWPQNTAEQSAIFVAMRGNEEGWRTCLRQLQFKAKRLGGSLVQLGTVIGDMSKLAAAASRRNMVQVQPGHTNGTASASNTAARSKYTNGAASNSSHARNISIESVNKPLPKDPDSARAAAQATSPRIPKTSMQLRYETPRTNPSSSAAINPARNHERRDQVTTTPMPGKMSSNGHVNTAVNNSAPSTRTRSDPKAVSVDESRPRLETTPKTHDSAYASGSDQAPEPPPVIQRTPSRLGFFPETSPPSPHQASRSTGTSPVSPKPVTAPFAPNNHTIHRSPSFSIKKIFGRKH